MRDHVISKVTVWPLRVPIPRERLHCEAFLHEPLARGPTGGYHDGVWFADQLIFVVKVESRDGVVGWGDVSHALKLEDIVGFAPVYLGLSEADLDVRDDRIPESTGVRGTHTAALDWATRQRGVPLHTLFGPKVRERVRVSFWSGFRSPQGAARIAREAFERSGIRAMKLKAGEDTDAAGIVAAVREAVGEDYDLVIDPNGRWEDADDVMRRARECMQVAGGTRVYFEDPHHPDSILPAIKQETGIHIARTTDGIEGVAKLKQRSGADVLNLVREWWEIIDASAAAEAEGLPVWAGSAATSGLGDVASLHFALTQPAFSFGADLAASQARDHDLLARPVKVVDGYAHVPDGPGLGVEADVAALARYAVDEPVVLQ